MGDVPKNMNLLIFSLHFTLASGIFSFYPVLDSQGRGILVLAYVSVEFALAKPSNPAHL